MPSDVLSKHFPFSAVVGLDDVKKALECAAIDDDLTGVLIKGATGTAKSVLVRSFVNLVPGKDIVNVPQNVTEEQLFGGMDIEDAIKHGKAVMKEGLLQRANGNILYLDNVNLFDKKLLSSILECVESGKILIEREGISAEYDLNTTIIATMDPAEQMLPDQMMDRFDICVQTYSAQNEHDRYDIILMNLEFDSDPDSFIEKYSKEDEELVNRITASRKKLSGVSLTKNDIEKISQVCINLNAKGHRGDISVARVARILAAFDGVDKISDNNIRDAAILCLLHRRGEGIKENEMPKLHEIEIEEEEEEKREEPEIEEIEGDILDEDGEFTVRYRKPEAEKIAETVDHTGSTGEDRGSIAEITRAVKGRLEDMDAIESVRLHKIAGGTGRRNSIATKKHTGRYRGPKMPDGRSSDPAFDATVRVAAPYQTVRNKRNLSIAIEPQDIRDKIRVKRDSCSFLFAVDVSGSLVDSGMMQDIKDGVKAMLMDGYVQRDKVALMTFRWGEVKISVPFTRSVEGICDILDNTVTGGGTPLGSALLVIREYMLNYIRKNPEERCYIFMITDGEATNPVIRGREASIELRKIAATMNIPNTEWVVIDSSLVPGRINHALKLAYMLGGRYIRLEDLKNV